VGVDVGESVGAAVGPVGSGAGVDRGAGGAVARGVETGAGLAVGRGVGAAVGRGVGLAVGLGVGFGVGLGVGAGVGVAATVMVTEPAASWSSNRSRLIASKEIVCVPTGSRPVHVKVTSRFQSGLGSVVVIGRAAPATETRTQFAGEPSRLR
jgi:hypothetical protein